MVANNVPITGRVVAMPRRTAIAPRHPSQGQHRLAMQVPCPKQREQQETVEEQNGRGFHPTANGILAHRIGRHTHHQPEREQKASWPRRSGETANAGKEENWFYTNWLEIVDVTGPLHSTKRITREMEVAAKRIAN